MALPVSGQPLSPEDYATQAAEKSRREMAMALMNGPVQNRQPTHPLQAFGNIANTALGTHQMNKANEMGRASDLHDASTFRDNIWGSQRPPVPGVGGPPMPFQAGGQIPGQPGVPPPSPQPSPPMPMAGGPLPGSPPSPPDMPGQMSGQGVPFLGAGGFPPGGGTGWPEMPQQGQSPWANLFGVNPQG